MLMLRVLVCMHYPIHALSYPCTILFMRHRLHAPYYSYAILFMLRALMCVQVVISSPAECFAIGLVVLATAVAIMTDAFIHVNRLSGSS